MLRSVLAAGLIQSGPMALYRGDSMGQIYIMERNGKYFRATSRSKMEKAEGFGYNLITTIFGKNISCSGITCLIKAADIQGSG